MAAVSTLHVSDVPTHTRKGPEAATSAPAKSADAGDVTASVTYSLPPPEGEQLFFRIYQGDAPAGQPSTNVKTEVQEVRIRNIRNLQQKFDIDTNGFQLERLVVPDIDWSDDKQVCPGSAAGADVIYGPSSGQRCTRLLMRPICLAVRPARGCAGAEPSGGLSVG